MRHRGTWVKHFVWLLAACCWAESQGDLAVIRQMRVHAAGVKHARIFHRSPVDAGLDAVFALGGPLRLLGNGNSGPWERDIQLGIFLQQRSNPGVIYKIVVADAPPLGEWTVRVERVTSSEAVIACLPEKGNQTEYHKFIYDLRAKALVARFSYQSFLMSYISTSGPQPVLIGWNGQRSVAIEHAPGIDPPFRVLTHAETQASISKVPSSKAWNSFIGAARTPLFAPVRFGPSGRFALSLRQMKRPSGLADKLAILERTGKSVRWFDLPQSSYDEFNAARPKRVEGGYTRGQTTIEEGIGPWQIVDGTLWFGKAFYDGEGMSGVGGFGYFDTESRQFRLHSPPQSWDYSASALLLDGDAVWLALEQAGEWASTGGGVVRFSRSGQLLDRIPIAERVAGIARVNGQILMATDYGAALFDGLQVRRFFIDQSRSGRLRVVEALPGNYAGIE